MSKLKEKGAEGYMINVKEVTLLTRGDVFGSHKIEAIFKNQGKAIVTDFAMARGCYGENANTKTHYGTWYLKSSGYTNSVDFISSTGDTSWMLPNKTIGGIRPVLKGDFSNISEEEITYGEYPMWAVENSMQQFLEQNDKKIQRTGKEYTLIYPDNSSDINSTMSTPEFSYHGKKYVRIPYTNRYKLTLSNDNKYSSQKEKIWFEVVPITWIVDKENNQLISKNIINAGIPFCNDNQYNDIFEETIMYHYLNEVFQKEMIPSVSKEIPQEEKEEVQKREKEMSKKRNRYQFCFDTVKEEDILKGAIDADIPVFLHGASAEGKSSRVKQIDPNCFIIHMENATLDSFVGKSVYSEKTGRMMNLPPAWYDELVSLCEKEPHKNHILFFEEFTNATPSVQGKANNVILDRIVDGKWRLPDNVRIVGAGNEVEDSLAANPMTETVFSRFAHVYIKTSTKDWLKWAKKNQIHPMICSYIAYRRGEVLRSDYDGVYPNADPRKWEMASKMLYKTNNPLMLRALVGEEITMDFISFCNSRIITLEDVLQGNYTEEEIESLNVSERYATTMALLDTDDKDYEIIKEFIQKMGTEFEILFTSLWVEKIEDEVKQLENSFQKSKILIKR